MTDPLTSNSNRNKMDSVKKRTWYNKDKKTHSTSFIQPGTASSVLYTVLCETAPTKIIFHKMAGVKRLPLCFKEIRIMNAAQ